MWIAGHWERRIAVNAADEEETRQGRLFNILMIICMADIIGIVFVFLLLESLGKLAHHVSMTAIYFFLLFLFFSLFCLVRAKQGRIRSTIRIFIWGNVLGITLGIWIFDGITSPLWSIFVSSITVAGILLVPVYVLWITGGVVVYFLVLYLLHLSGLYMPQMTFGPARELISILIFMCILCSLVALPTYLNMRGLRSALKRLKTTTTELEEHRITLEQRVKERTEELTKANATLNRLATRDILTDLPNRMFFSRLLNRAIQSAERYNRKFAVFFIDLDRFKYINDTLGHAAGDQVLREIALRLKQTLRAVDVVARFGGDEFIILIDEIGDLNQISTVAQKVLSTIAAPIVLMGEESRVTASIGISIYPKDASDEQSLLHTADTAMYFAKEDGKNNYRFYSKEVQSKFVARQSIAAHLQTVLERQELSLHYQAMLDFKTNAIRGVEALLRWQNPHLGSVTPTQFIPVAEETGLIVPIGRWVLKTACAQNVAWQHQGLPAVCMAVNVSFHQFTNHQILRDIEAALKDSGMAPHWLEIEITESMLTHNPAYVVSALAEIKKMGVRVAIDNFGTAYSSLAQIKNFPVDTLKVDRSFIRNIPQDTGNKATTLAIIAMAKALSLSVIAEGVETQEQADFLQKNACDEMQGYSFSRPIPPAEFSDLLRNHVPLPLNKRISV
jgi:diguanylate cyclase (GGDEF)-like protein